MFAISDYIKYIDRNKLESTIKQIVDDFNDLNSDTIVSYKLITNKDLLQNGKVLTRLGLGPDIILSSSRNLISLKALKMISSPPPTPSKVLGEFLPDSLNVLREGSQLQALPAFQTMTLMCYDRRHIASPPSTPRDLKTLADKGLKIGLANDLPFVLWMTSILTNNRSSASSLAFKKRFILGLTEWLTWSQRNPNVITSSKQDYLNKGLIDGKLSLISCPSFWVSSLSLGMNHYLGIAPLPTGGARPIADLFVWTFGRNSSTQQRKSALKFVLFTTNSEQQRRMAELNGSLISINNETLINKKEHPSLYQLALAGEKARFLNMSQIHHVNQVRPQLQHLLDEVNAGQKTAQEAALTISTLLDPYLGSKP